MEFGNAQKIKQIILVTNSEILDDMMILLVCVLLLAYLSFMLLSICICMVIYKTGQIDFRFCVNIFLKDTN